MIKRLSVFALLLLVATAAYAPCFYPRSEHVDYWQYHASCYYGNRWPICEEWWSLDGTCDTDCDGNTYCDGDTHIDSRTILDYSSGYCDPICE